MKALSITFGVSVLACGNQPCGTSTYTTGSNSLFSANKPWQASTPSSWQNSPPSLWTPSTQTPQTPPPTSSISRPNPSFADHSPSEQLQLTKCRSAQSCEKCRQLNCYWDSSARITNRCIALGLESSQIPIDAGEASNLGYCPTAGQQGFLGVNWLAIENSGAAVPNLDGMSDADVQKWLSSIPNYNPDATDANYPAGAAFKDLLPTAAKAYADGKIPSTTPWVSFFNAYLGGGYNYDNGGDNSAGSYNSGYNNMNGGYNYDNNGYSYDASNSLGIPSNANGLSGAVSNSAGLGGISASGMFPSNLNGFGSPSFGATSNFGGTSNFGSFGSGNFGSSLSFGGSFPATSAFSGSLSMPSVPSDLGFSSSSFGFPSSSVGFPSSSVFPSSSIGFPPVSTLGLSSIPQPASSLPMFPSVAAGSPLPLMPSSSIPGAPLSSIAAPLPMPPAPGLGSMPQPFGG